MTGVPTQDRAAPDAALTGAAPAGTGTAGTGTAGPDGTGMAREDRLAQARARRAARRPGGVETVVPGIPIRPAGSTPLSSAQRRFWFVRQLDPAHDPFHLPVVLRLAGPVDPDRLTAAFLAVVARHEVLRTRIVEVDGEPRAVVDAAPAGSARLRDVRPEDLDAAVRAAADAPFDLAADQPWRLDLLRTGPAAVTLVATFHHVAFDGWSAGVLLTELGAGYRGEALPLLPVQYADLAHHRGTPEGREGARVEHWVRHLAGAPATLGFPTDRPRTPVTRPTQAEETDRLDPRALHAVMAGAGCTAFMVLLAAWHVVLSRWTGGDDVVIGTAVAGRGRPETAPLIGCCVGTLALRTTSGGPDSVRDLLTRTRAVVLDGLDHQGVGYEEVVEALHRSGSGLFDVSLTVHTEPEPALLLPGVTVTVIDLPGRWAQNEIELSVAGPGLTGAGDVEVTAQFFAELLDPATVRRLLGHLDQVLRGFAADLDRPVAAVPLLTGAELAELPALTGADVPAPVPDGRRVEEIVADRAARTPDAVAVTSGGVDLTYRELLARAGGVAAALAAAGVVPGDRVGLFTERSVDAVIGMLGAWRAGAAYVPVDPLYPDGRVRQVLDAAGVRSVLTQRPLRDRVAGLDVVLVEESGTADPPAVRDPDTAAYVLFTSGTTGAPKGVVVGHRQLAAYLAGMRRMLPVADGWSWATMSTLAADLGLTNVLGALTTGGRLHLLSYQEVTDPAATARYFARHRIDAVKMVPSHLQALWDDAAPAAVLPRRLLVLAGEGLPWALADRIRAAAPDLELHNHYGPTETTVSTMGLRVEGAGPRREDRPVPLGRPFPGTRAHVLDAAGRPVPVGAPGELVIAGPTVSLGYLDRPDLTAERFAADLDPDHRAYRTGDRVRRLPGGAVEFLGRTDDQVKIRGYRVEPAEVARVIAARPDVADCAVLPHRHAGRDRLAAYVVATGPLDVAALRAELRTVLPDYLVPADYVLLDAIPLTANGKPDRSALPAPVPAATASSRPQGATEERVAAVWAAVLGLGEVGAEDDFFDLGGDSFATVKVVRGLTGDVSVVDVFGAPTVRELAGVLDRRAAGGRTQGGLLRRLGRSRATAEVHLVCVPFGGGSPVAFAPLADALGDGIAVHGVDLPGHDTSRPQDGCRPLPEVAAALVAELLELPGDIVLYGHCLGGALAAATALGLEAAGRPVLGLVEAGTFPSARLPGRLSAWLHRWLPGDRLLSDRAYLESLRSLGGFPDDLDPADQRLLMTALRHDSREAESWYTERYAAADRPRIGAPLLCVVGERDRSTQLYQERYAEWRDVADDVELAVIPAAGHFFARHQAAELAGVLADRVHRWRRGERPSTPRPDLTEPAVRTFLAVALTQLLSMVGTGLTSFALGIWVFQRTGSVTAFATIAVMVVLPAILAMPLAGAVADRFDRRRVMLLADSVAAVMTAGLVALLALGRLELWFVYLFAGMGALAGAFQRPAYLAAITQLVPKRHLGQANGLVSLGINAGDLVAALAGGVLIGLVGLPGVVAVDVVTFLAATVVIVLVRFPDRMFVRREEGFGKEVTGGWRYIVARPQLVALVVFFCLFNYLFTFPVTLATPLLLANDSPAVLGMVTAFGGLGAVAGTVLMALWGGTRYRAVGMVGGTVVLGLAVVVLGLSPHPGLVATGLFGVYGALLLVNAHWLSLIQAKVGLELQGRVLATNQMLAMAMMPLGFLTVGPVTGWLGARLPAPPLFGAAAGAGYGSTLVVVGVALTAWGVVGLLWPTLRRMDVTLPDAVADSVIAGDKDALQRAADLRLAS